MKSILHTKPLWRALTVVGTNATNNNVPSPSPPPYLPLLRFHPSRSSSSTTPIPSDDRVLLSATSLVPMNNILFLQRSFASRTYSIPEKSSSSFPRLLTFATIGSAVLLLGSYAADAIGFPFSSKSNAASRMKERLERHGFIEKPVVPDGNCQMRALSDQMFGDEQYHKDVRLKVMKWLGVNEKFSVEDNGSATLGDFIDRDQFPSWSSYVGYMSQNGAWGDHITLVGAAEAYAITINIVSNVDDNGTGQYMTLIKPRSAKSTKDVYLSHWHEMHYNSLYPTQQPKAQAA